MIVLLDILCEKNKWKQGTKQSAEQVYPFFFVMYIYSYIVFFLVYFIFALYLLCVRVFFFVFNLELAK